MNLVSVWTASPGAVEATDLWRRTIDKGFEWLLLAGGARRIGGGRNLKLKVRLEQGQS